MFKLGIDIGGTFTDFVLLDTDTGRRYVDKVLTTAGFRDLLERRRGKRFDMDDLLIEVPQPLIPRRLVREAPERMSKDGIPLVPLKKAGTRKAIRELID